MKKCRPHDPRVLRDPGRRFPGPLRVPSAPGKRKERRGRVWVESFGKSFGFLPKITIEVIYTRLWPMELRAPSAQFGIFSTVMAPPCGRPALVFSPLSAFYRSVVCLVCVSCLVNAGHHSSSESSLKRLKSVTWSGVHLQGILNQTLRFLS